MKVSHAWLTWASVVLFAIWILGAFQYVKIPLVPVLAAFAVLMLLNALRLFPRENLAVRRRLPFLALLALPWIISILYGPLGFVEVSWHAAQRESMREFQGWLIVVSALLPLLLLPSMSGGRAFTVVVGILNVVATFVAASTAMFLNSPGS